MLTLTLTGTGYSPLLQNTYLLATSPVSMNSEIDSLRLHIPWNLQLIVKAPLYQVLCSGFL